MLYEATDLLLAEKRAGNYGDNDLKPVGLEQIRRAINIKFQKDYNASQVKSAIPQTLKPLYKVYDKLRDESGIGWDADKQCLTAMDNISKHKKAKRFKNSSFPPYEKLREVFDGQTATAAHARSSSGPSATTQRNPDDADGESPGEGQRTPGDNSESAVGSPVERNAGDAGTTHGRDEASVEDAEVTRRWVRHCRRPRNKQMIEEATTVVDDHKAALKQLQEDYVFQLELEEMVLAVRVLPIPQTPRPFSASRTKISVSRGC